MMNELKRNETVFEGDRIDLSKSIPLAGPLLVHLETTNRCNFKCKFCPESLETYREEAGGLFIMSNEDFERIIDQLAAMPQTPRMLNMFTMGEPLMNKSIFSQVRYAKNKLPNTLLTMSSNGALLSSEKYEKACDSGLDILRISIFGHDEESHLQNTQKKTPLSKIRDNVRGLVEFRNNHGYAGPHIYVKAIESPNNEHNQSFLTYFDGVADRTVIEGLSNWNDDTGKFSETYGVDMEALSGSDYFNKPKDVCPYPFYSFVIHSDLTVSVCCIDWNKKTKIGNLTKQSVEEVWKSEELLDFQMLHLTRQKKKIKACANCTYYHTLKDNLDQVDAKDFVKAAKR